MYLANAIIRTPATDIRPPINCCSFKVSPNTKKESISTDIGSRDLIKVILDKSVISGYELESFEVEVLDIKRTFVEKILSLIRIGISDDSNFTGLRNKIRHFYDIAKLYSTGEIKEFVKGIKG